MSGPPIYDNNRIIAKIATIIKKPYSISLDSTSLYLFMSEK